jgi:hypothetical protein
MIRDVHSFSKLKGVPLLWRSKGVLPLLLYLRDYRRKDITLVCVFIFVSERTNKRHHHHRLAVPPPRRRQGLEKEEEQDAAERLGAQPQDQEGQEG